MQRAKTEYQQLQTINHLSVIGIMQNIYMEQGCLRTLKQAITLGSDKTSFPNYKSIRSLRNEAFGHPTLSGTKNDSRVFFDIKNNNSQIIRITNWGESDKAGAHNST